MDVKAILKNVKKEGIRATLKKRRIRQEKKKLEAIEVSRRCEVFRKVFETLKEEDISLEMKEIIKLGANERNLNQIYEFLRRIGEMNEEKSYEKIKLKLEKTFIAEAQERKYHILKNILKELSLKEQSENVAMLIEKGLCANDLSEIQDIFLKLDQLTVNNYKAKIKQYYIKELLPQTYKDFSFLPLEKKVIFMQPRSGLNQSCRYIYHVLEEEGEYEELLFELHRDSVGVFQYYENAEKFIRAMGTAKGVFVHESNDLMGYLDIRKGTKVIQLWHGCGVLKKIGLSTADKKRFKSSKTYQEYPEYNNYSIVTIASPELSWVFEEFMGLKKEQGIIQPIGVSRTDEFFSQEYINQCYEKLYKIIPFAKEKKVILYAPTYRGLDPNRVSPDALDIEAFAKALEERYVLVFKHHQTVKEVPEIPEPYRNNFAYDMTRGKGMSINELMTVADICISDYSSLIFEYSLFERPLIFYAYDLDEYIDNRGLYYDYDEITPGPVCRTNEEMIDYILHIDERFDKQEVVDFKNKFMCSCDGHSTERIIEFMKKD